MPYHSQVEMVPKILSVDDSKTVRTHLSRVLSPFACELCEASNGEEGLAIAIQERPDLIILDYNMPVMDGVTMLQRLREDPAVRQIPVIMLTTESSAEKLATIARLGVHDYITKPFNEKLLLAKVGRVVSLVERAQLEKDGHARDPVKMERPKGAMEFAEGDSSQAPASLQRASVLVVDDSRTMRLTLVRELNELGFNNIKEVTNGRQALELILKDSFDLVLLDMEMPEMNGLELLMALRKNTELDRPPVIVISAADQIENAVKCIEAGAEDYL